MMSLLKTASDSLSVGELREKCRQEVAAAEPTPVQDRLNKDRDNILEPFTIMSHRPNYILPLAHNLAGYDSDVYQEQANETSIAADDTEVQFQISIKTPLAVNLFNRNIDIFAAYTNHSFWQLYNDSSAPFRETNHEPEAWLQFRPGWHVLGFTNSVNAFGINHQSNGRSGALSRSWNRIFANFVFERDNFAVSFRPWHRIEEDTEDDDNPDLTDYMGHFELHAAYKRDEHVFTLMSRNNIESGFSEGALEFSWSFPLGDYPFLKGYVQCFSGYGESLIDYDHYVNKIGLGVALTDWL